MRVIVLLLLAAVAVRAQDDANETYCDEVEEAHPADAGVSATGDPPGTESSLANSTAAAGDEPLPGSIVEDYESQPDEGPIPGAVEKAKAVQKMITTITEKGVSEGIQSFSTDIGSKVQQIGSVVNRMKDRQGEINDLYYKVLPSLEKAVGTRVTRVRQLKEQIAVMNSKLESVVNGLDRASYVEQQRTYMNIISSLMQLQNSLEGTRSMATPSRPTIKHPGHNNNNHALISIDAETVPAESSPVEIITTTAAPATSTSSNGDVVNPTEYPVEAAEAQVKDLMDALDLLELSSTTVSTSIPYARRKAILARRVQGIIRNLIAVFSKMRDNHREFASANRDMWSREIDVLQQQSEYLVNNMESVLQQTRYYISSYLKQKTHLMDLTKLQRANMERTVSMQGVIRKAGEAFNDLSGVRAKQLIQFHEVAHFLTSSGPFTTDVFQFACDGVNGGSAKVDKCGICGGDNTTCSDCAGVPSGLSVVDVCGVCGGGGQTCSFFCDGLPNSGKLMDLCGQCGGNSDSCLGCDGIPNSGMIIDSCGVCGGDDTMCEKAPNIRDAMSPVPSRSEDVVTARIRLLLGAKFSEWESRHVSLFRAALANVTGVSMGQVSVVDVESTPTSVTVRIGIMTAKLSTETTKAALQRAAVSKALSAALAAQFITSDNVELLDGPTVNQAPLKPKPSNVTNNASDPVPMPMPDTDPVVGMCPQDVKPCSDGSTVSRDPESNCDFKRCPDFGALGCCVGPYTVTKSGTATLKTGVTYPTGYTEDVPQSTCKMASSDVPGMDAGGTKTWHAGKCIDAKDLYEVPSTQEQQTAP